MAQPQPNPPVLGIDLGATNMLLGLVDEDGRVLSRRHRETEGAQGVDHVIENVAQGARDIAAAAGLAPESLAGIGVAVAGAVDATRGVVLNGFNLNWHDAPLAARLESLLGAPVLVDNDVNAAVWGEYTSGAGRGCRDCFGVWVGSGIGGGIVLGGALYHGAFSTAGEFGLTISHPDGPTGARTVEDLAGRIGMRRQIARELPSHDGSMLHELCKGKTDRLGTAELARAYATDDDLACRIINHGADRIGVAIANFVTMLSIDTVILGGGLVEAFGDPYLNRIRAAFARDVFPERCRECRLLRTELEGDAGVIGAALLARAAAHRGPD